MAMSPNCIAAVTAAAGRPLSGAQIKGIEDRLRATARRLASTDPQWQSKSADQRTLEAAQAAMQDVQAEAARKVANVQRQALKAASIEQTITDAQARGGSRHQALAGVVEQTSRYIDAIRRQTLSTLMPLMDAAGSGQGAGAGRKALMFLFDAQNPQMTRDLVAEVFSNGKARTGNKMAADAARAWLDTIEAMRQRFNAAGGDIGKLVYGYLPQPHDSARVRAAGKEAWAAKTLPALDRSRYVREDGARMNDAEVLDFLRASFDTISTDGLNKAIPGQFTGTGARANRGGESRQIHFKDGEAYLGYMGEFGSGSMYDAMVSHVGGLSRDIGLVEQWGPNPAAQFRLQADLAKQADGGSKRVFGNKVEAYWRLIDGSAGSPDHARLAAVGQHIRNIQVFGKLAGAVISSITDLGTLAVTAGYNKLPYWQLVKDIGTTAKSADAREFLTTHGVIAESMAGDLNRWAGEHLWNNWSGRLANSTMKLSLMNAWTDTLRRGFSMTMMQSMGKLAGKQWADLTEWDRSHLGRKGITEADWQVVTQAQLTDFQGRKMLTPEAIMDSGDPRAQEVSAKVLGFITDESEFAVLNPDLATRAIGTGGALQAGTGWGELARAVMQFKSFPIAMISRHWRRILDAPQGLDGAPALANKGAYTAALLLTTTALGAVAFQAKQLVQGKDPVDMTTPKFWGKAVAQGGGLGFVADLLLADSTDERFEGESLWRLLGPTAGSVASIYELTKGNIDEALAGKDTHAGAEALRFARSHLPLVNLWYGKAALEHLFLHSMQENLSPGYLHRVKNKARKDWGQGYWWEPGASFDDMRAPDLGAAAGGSE